MVVRSTGTQVFEPPQADQFQGRRRPSRGINAVSGRSKERHRTSSLDLDAARSHLPDLYFFITGITLRPFGPSTTTR